MKIGTIHAGRRHASRRGAALIYATMIALAISGLAIALLFMNMGTSKVRVETRTTQRSFYAAEAGLSDAYMMLTENVVEVDPGDVLLVGDPSAPLMLGPSSYYVEIEGVDTRSWTVTSTGTDGGHSTRLQILVGEKPTSIFQFAAFGDEGVILDSNAFIDSYDSALGSYDSQIKGGNDFAKENGDVGSNQDILLKSNTEVHGDAIPGPGYSVDDSAPGAYVSGSTEPAEELFPFPEIVPPVIASSGSYSTASNLTVGPGLVHYDSILMDGGTVLEIVGPATVVIDDLELKSGAELLFTTDGGPVDVYATADFVLQSNSKVTTVSNSALDVTLLLSGNNMTKNPPDQVKLSSNSEFVGAIYAPDAKISLGSNFDIYGSVMAGFLDLSSNGEIHYDEALAYDGFGSSDEFEASLWRTVGLD